MAENGGQNAKVGRTDRGNLESDQRPMGHAEQQTEPGVQAVPGEGQPGNNFLNFKIYLNPC